MPPWMPGPDSARSSDATSGGSPGRARDARRAGRRGRAVGDPATAGRSPRSARASGAGAPRHPWPPRAYTPHAAGGGIDDYHCFVLDPKLTADAYVTAALIRPERTGSVHHVILYEAAGAQAVGGRDS